MRSRRAGPRRVVPHGERPLAGTLVGGVGVHLDERVHPPAVPALVLRTPRVGQVEGAVGDVRSHRVEVEREQPADRSRGGVRRVGLRERAEVAGRMVVESPHARVAAVVVVERAVLHHQEDHVFDRTEVGARGRDGSGPCHRGVGGPLAARGSDQPEPRGCARGQQLASAHRPRAHWPAFRSTPPHGAAHRTHRARGMPGVVAHPAGSPDLPH